MLNKMNTTNCDLAISQSTQLQMVTTLSLTKKEEHKCRRKSFHTIQMPSPSVSSFHLESSTRYVYTYLTCLLSCCQSPALSDIQLATSRRDSTQQDHERVSWNPRQPLCSEDDDSDSVYSQYSRLHHYAAFWSQECHEVLQKKPH